MTIQTAVASIEEDGTTIASCKKQEIGEVCTSVADLVSCCCSLRFYSAEEKDSLRSKHPHFKIRIRVAGRGVVTCRELLVRLVLKFISAASEPCPVQSERPPETNDQSR